jgi:ketosteroid isomerase-like protein
VADDTGQSPSGDLIQRYLHIVQTDDYAGFGELLTDDCTLTLMPSGRTFIGRDQVMGFTELAGNSRTHDQRASVTIKNWFTDGRYLCVEYNHQAVIKRLGFRIKIDGYCWIFHIRDGRFDEMREYINPSRLSMGLLLPIVLKAVAFRTRSASA